MHPTDRGTELAVINEIAAAREALTVERVFGQPTTIGDTIIVPVARIIGGAGGGAGAGADPDQREGHGSGTGFGLSARPVGVYQLRTGHVRWRPILDADRLLRGAQILTALALVCATLLNLRRANAHHSASH